MKVRKKEDNLFSEKFIKSKHILIAFRHIKRKKIIFHVLSNIIELQRDIELTKEQ